MCTRLGDNQLSAAIYRILVVVAFNTTYFHIMATTQHMIDYMQLNPTEIINEILDGDQGFRTGLPVPRLDFSLF